MVSDVPEPAVDAAGSMRRRPAWIPTVAAFATIAVCIVAGNWQHRRMLEKEALQAQISAAAAAAPIALPAGVGDWRAWRFRTVEMTGTFDAPRQILIDNSVRAGRAGFAVVTPFVLADGRTVLVDRGWTAGGGSRAVLPNPRPPQGTVTLRGRIDLPPTGYLRLGDQPIASGPLWQRLDPRRFAEATGIDVLPIVVEALEDTGGDALAADVALPDTGVAKHLSYMVQWYTFAAMAAGLWLWFTVRPLCRRRRPRPNAGRAAARGRRS